MADIAIFRINYKSDFILTLNSDAGWLTPFCIKFWTGAPSQAYYAYYDGMTYTHCAPVEDEPTKLMVQFDDHHLPIGDLKFQIGYHFTVADFPTSVEDEVLNQASVIIEHDGEPAQVMLDFNGETAPEIEFSLPAYANEAQRIANEQERIENELRRINNEQQRISNEEVRISAEESRQTNELQRIHNEEARIAEFASLKADAIAATDAANASASLANEKAQLAADKAALAQAAATLANEKAQLAADKAALAQAAATLANDKAALAQQKADYAQTQGDYAKAQGDYAKEQGDTALDDHERAEADHETATDDHATASSDHTRAEQDHVTASNDHTRADSDHARAEEDHSTASADHTTATNDHTQAVTDHATATSDHEQAGQDHARAESDHTRAESDHAAVEVFIDSLGVFDLSKYNAVDGVLAKYADLTAALTALNALDSKYKYGGMSFKFVQSSDNKYVQFFCTANEFTTDVTKWQGVDEEPIAESKSMIASNAVSKIAQNITLIAKGGNNRTDSNRDVINGHLYKISLGNTSWDISGGTTYSIWMVYLINKNDNNKNIIIVEASTSSEIVKDTYIEVPDGDDWELSIRIRGKKEEQINVSITDLTSNNCYDNVLKGKLLLSAYAKGTISNNGTETDTSSNNSIRTVANNIISVNDNIIHYKADFTKISSVIGTTVDKTSVYICCYDNNKTFLGKVEQNIDNTIELLENTSYVRIIIQFYYGNTPVDITNTYKKIICSIYDLLEIRQNHYNIESVESRLDSHDIVLNSHNSDISNLKDFKDSISSYEGVDRFIIPNEYTQYRGITTDSGKWTTAGNGKHILIPVQQGERYCLIGNEVYYGLLTSEHSEPVVNNSMIEYVDTSIVIRPVVTDYNIIEVPSGAAYLMIVTKYYSGNAVHITGLLKINNDFEKVSGRVLYTLINDSVEYLKGYTDNKINFNSIKRTCALNADKLPIISSLSRAKGSGYSIKKYFSFAHISDTHAINKTVKRAVEYLNDTAIDMLIHTGDIQRKSFNDEELSFVGKVNDIERFTEYVTSSVKPVLIALGNHDQNGGNITSKPITKKKLYDRFMAPMVEKGWLTAGTNIDATNYATYFYKDFASYGIRVIVLNSFDPLYDGYYTSKGMDDNYTKYSQAQIDFLIATLNSTPSGYHIVLGLHTPYDTNHRATIINSDWSSTAKNTAGTHGNGQPILLNGNPMLDILKAYKEKSTLTNTYTYTDADVQTQMGEISVDVDFSDAVGIIAFMAIGHNHDDWVGNFESYANIKCVCMPGSILTEPDGDVGRGMMGGADEWKEPISSLEDKMIGKPQDSINVYVVNKDLRRVYIVKVGADFTTDARERKLTYIDY